MSARFSVGVAGLVVRDGAVLLLKRAATKSYWPGEWAPVTDKLEACESPEAGLRREVREETRLTVDVEADPIGTWHIPNGAGQDDLIGITFVCPYVSGRVLLSDEHDAHEWVAIRDLGRVPLVAPLRPAFERLKALFTMARELNP
ncbi:MAG: NUDIX domain-containing protein [Alphaproteobacteria bacterium]|nr:NUDIX domain-containing protein [Alphaproteobacteria bacterium]